MSYLGYTINKLLTLFNLKLVKIKPLDFYDSTRSFQTIRYQNKSLDLLLKVEINKGRGLPFFQYGENSIHPFLIGLKNNYDSSENLEMVLSDYYKIVNFKNVAELLDLKENKKLLLYPHWATIMPWKNEKLDDWQFKVRKNIKTQNFIEGKFLKQDNGWAWTGKTSNKKMKLEARRTINLYKKILKYGYNRKNHSDGDILCDILVDENNNWVWQSIQGQHRAICLSALGYEKIIIRINNIIYKNEAELWPNVVNQTFSIEEAKKVFDMIFQNKENQKLSDWRKFITNHYD
jgi:hypothetical protein